MGILDKIFGGGGETTKTEIDPRVKQGLYDNLDRAQAFSRLGYMPYYGPTVAAMTPSQTSAMGNTASMMRSYGMQAPESSNLGMPQAQDYGGMQAYSSGGLFDQALSELQSRRPGQYKAYTDMFIDPQTGSASMMDQNQISTQLQQAGVPIEIAAGAASGDTASINALEQFGISGDTINKMRSFSSNPLIGLIPFGGIAGLLASMAADQYAGGYNAYGNDMFYSSDGMPTPVRGSDYYSSSEAASNRDSFGVSGGGYVGSGGGNASRGFNTGGW